MIERTLRPNCPDCGAGIGSPHQDGCDVERCMGCGGQLISCGSCPYTARQDWTGEWPGVAECREFGWYAKFTDGEGWVSCSKDEPGAKENLNRLHVDAVWDVKERRFVKRR